MKITITGNIVDEDDNLIPKAEGGNVTVGDALLSAHTATFADDTGEAKLARYKMRKRVKAAMKNGGALELDAGEMATMKTLIGRACTTNVVGQLWEFMESAETPGKADN